MKTAKIVISILIILAGLWRILVWQTELNNDAAMAPLGFKYASTDEEKRLGESFYLEVRKEHAEDRYRHILFEGLSIAGFGLLLFFIPVVQKSKKADQ